MKYKKTRFETSQEIRPGIFLCSEFNTSHHILVSKAIHDLYNGGSSGIACLKDGHPKVFERLVQGNFLVSSKKDELQEELKRRKETIQNRDMLHVIVNPTLDCNLSCWYCYENKIPKSRINRQIQSGIERYVKRQFESEAFSTLKLSFFGGEPFMQPIAIKNITSKLGEFCKEKNVSFILDFTTNGTLCTEEIIDFIKDYYCMFQITLDGNKEQHNRIKHTTNKTVDTFSLTLRNIHLIQEKIRNSQVSVRINFDSDTLSGFDSILQEIIDLDRSRTQVILKRIWQVDAKEISSAQVFRVIDKLLENKFSVDYYSQGGICFADRSNQVTINYDGNVFKCTTVSRFDEETSLGKLNSETGEINWKEEKIRYLSNEDISGRCYNCRMLPDCTGQCRKHMAEGRGDECFLYDLEMSIEDYALMQFRLDVVNQRIKQENI